MHLSRHGALSAACSQACRLSVKATLHGPRLARQDISRANKPFFGVKHTSKYAETPHLDGCRLQAAAAAAASPAAAQHVEYQVAGSTFSVSLRGGSNGTGQPQFLRLQEASADSEYVLVLPVSVASVLLEVLERAVQCIVSGNNGRPLELHHTVLQGSRTFKCSLVYTPAALSNNSSSRSSSSSSSSSSSHVAADEQQQVVVSAQELGRSCVHLPVTLAVRHQVQQLMELLQAVPGQQQQQQPVNGVSVVTAIASATVEAQPASVAGLDTSATAAAPAPHADGADEQQPCQPAAEDAAATSPAAAAAESATVADVTAQSEQLLSANSLAATTSGAAEAAPTPASTHGVSSTAPPEILFAAISSSSDVRDGFRFAHAAAAEELGSTGSTTDSSADSSTAGQLLFQLPHLCCLWQKLPVYAASMQRQCLQGMGDSDDAADEALLQTELFPEVQQEVEGLVAVLIPLIQPQLPRLPRHMLQRLLQAASDAQQQLPGSFLAAWAEAAAAPSARGTWDALAPAAYSSSNSSSSSSLSALLEVSLLLADLGVAPGQPFAQGPVGLPLQWCAYALAEVSPILQGASLQLFQVTYGNGLTPQYAQELAAQTGAQAVVEDAMLLEQLLPVLLAAVGHNMQQQLWQSWAHDDSTSSSLNAAAAACLTSIAVSLQQLLGADSSNANSDNDNPLADLYPGFQQGTVIDWVLQLSQQQRGAAVAVIWSWLAFGGSASALSSSLLRRLLEKLPYDQAAAEYAAATASSSRSSLLEHVLLVNASSSSSSRMSGTPASGDAQQVESVSGLLAHALQTDSRAAFAALPSLLKALPDTPPAGGSSSSSSGQLWDEAVAELCGHLQQMLQLGPQQLLLHCPAVLQAVGQLSTSSHATSHSVLTVLQLAQQVADAADSWHAAAAAPELQGTSINANAAGGRKVGDDVSQQQIPTAVELAGCCFHFAPGFAQVCAQQQQQQQLQQQGVLPQLAELLQAAAAVHADHGQHSSLAPAWMSSSSSRSSDCLWQDFEQVLLSAAAAAIDGASTALDVADIATSASSLLVLGVSPSQQLLQAYWAAVGPEALGLSAVGLQQLLWIAASLLQQQQQGLDPRERQQDPQQQYSSISSEGVQGVPLLRLVSKACSSLAVRPASALSARQAAQATWALAQLASSAAAAAAGWSPPQQTVSWLKRLWQKMDGTTGSSSSSNSSRFGGGGGGVVVGLEAKVVQLQQQGILQQQEADELLSSMQVLGLVPGAPKQQQQQKEVVVVEVSSVPEQQVLSDQQQQTEEAELAEQHVSAQQQQVQEEVVGAQHQQQQLQDTVAEQQVQQLLQHKETFMQQQQQGVHRSDYAPSAATEDLADAEPGPAAAQPDDPVRDALSAQQALVSTAVQKEEEGTAPAAAAAAAAVVPPPPSVAETLQQLKEPGFSPTQKQAMQLLLPVQQYLSALAPAEVCLYVSSCFTYKVPLPAAALLTAAQAAAAATAGCLSGSTLLQLLSSIAEAVAAPAAAAAAAGATEGSAVRVLVQQGPSIVQQLLPFLGPQQLAAASAAELLQLLRDTYTLTTRRKPAAKSALPLGNTLFGTAAVTNSSSSSSSNGGSSQLDEGWLTWVASALEPKLLLFPHGSQLLQSLQLLQAQGLQQPSSSFMSSFLAAADALLDTLSGRNCLELLAATAAAGQLPSSRLTTALLQHLTPFKLSPADVAAGCRLLAALGIRPSGELLLHWFEITEAVADQMQPQAVVQVLWACCVWRVQPPANWLHAVLKGLTPAGRLSRCSAATLAGLCRCLWQLGVQPAPGVVAAVAAAAEHTMTGVQEPSSSSSGGWQYYQHGQQQQQEQHGAAMDAESFSVLCYSLFMWQHAGTPAWRVAVADCATALMAVAGGPSVLRLGMYLAYLHEESEGEAGGSAAQEEPLLPWQQAFLQAVPLLLPSGSTSGGQEVLLTVDGQSGSAAAAVVPQIPVWALPLASQILQSIPESSTPVLRGIVAAVGAAVEQEALTAWDAINGVSAYFELIAVLQQTASSATGPLGGLQAGKLMQEAEAVHAAAKGLLKYAYQHREGAPADVLATIPLLAAQLDVEMPQQSRLNLQAAEEAARAREQQLQEALLLQERGGPAVPEDLLQGLAELGPQDSAEVVAMYAAGPLQTALARRVYWLGGAVSDEWVLGGLSDV